MGHAGAIISGGKGTAAEKMAVMRAAGIHVVESPALLGETVERVLRKKKNGRPAAPRRTSSVKSTTKPAGTRRTPAKKKKR
jgi:hypothetical protein